MTIQKRVFQILSAFSAIITGFLWATTTAFAGEEGHAVLWQKGLHEPVTPVMERVVEFHNILLVIITAITLFVTALLFIIIIRFNAKANPKPSATTHSTMLEVVWTLVPVIILIAIAVKSLPLIYYMDRTKEPEMTLKVTGYQWYWGYEYPDHDGINFFSYMIPDEKIDPSKGQIRLLSTDTQVVLPIDTDIQILLTAADVIHSWAVPAFGVKRDAVPGRTNETWVRITKPGTYYGQCSELCGKDHAFMPIEIKAVTKEEFARWVETAKKEFAANDNNEEATIMLAKIEGTE